MGHTQEAAQYFLRMQFEEKSRWTSALPAIEFTLRRLGGVCRIILPLLNLGLPNLSTSFPPVQPFIYTPSPDSPSTDPDATSVMLQHLLDAADAYPVVKDLIWDPLKIHKMSAGPTQVLSFQDSLALE